MYVYVRAYVHLYVYVCLCTYVLSRNVHVYVCVRHIASCKPMKFLQSSHVHLNAWLANRIFVQPK